ncbi:hypothetical protein GCM10007173_20570 [Glutamicibacter ardleyensis]|uniref:Uncharacterized protein n=1 Tax=Glutamicibacter ardleyensis TaxID=225894 RepID=A0ABQ2DKN4_9MICC|nr:hypothetical protein GCM10007173_20570 [Glutamicibacter ardleyensis]
MLGTGPNCSLRERLDSSRDEALKCETGFRVLWNYDQANRGIRVTHTEWEEISRPKQITSQF